QTLNKCSSKLPAKQKLVFDMRELQGLDPDEVCKACDITATNLHVLLHRARLGLRHCLDQNWFGGSRS
ncbi:MAG: sigma factor-like helix-turn-helix DNA-binding protein, partial [Ghiorsea sp.]